MPEPELEPKVSELEELLGSKEPGAIIDAILGNTPSGAAIVLLPERKILRVSDYTARLFGRPRSELEGLTVEQFLERWPAYDETGRRFTANDRPLARALTGETVNGFEALLEAANGDLIPCVINAAPIRNSRGEVIGIITSLIDVRANKALERSLRDEVARREALHRELTHRVKNHLQILSALVSAEARNGKRSVNEVVEDMKGQLNAFAALYRGLDRAGEGSGVEALSFIEDICRPYAAEPVTVETTVEPFFLTLTSQQAGPVGMLVNEAVCNSRKHAFPDGVGRIRVSLRCRDTGFLRLEISDDGVGWGSAAADNDSQGLELMRLFAKQLHSELKLADSREGGARVAVDIPQTPERTTHNAPPASSSPAGRALQFRGGKTPR
jgi:PAS domain S-box-containing protein